MIWELKLDFNLAARNDPATAPKRGNQQNLIKRIKKFQLLNKLLKKNVKNSLFWTHLLLLSGTEAHTCSAHPKSILLVAFLFRIYIWAYFEINSCTILLVSQPCWFLSNCRFVFFLITPRCLNPWIIWWRTCVLYFVGIIVPLISVSGHFVNLIRGGRNWEVFQYFVCKNHLLYLILLWYQKVAIHFTFLICTVPSFLFLYLSLNNEDLVVDGFLLWLPPLGSSCKMKWL